MRNRSIIGGCLDNGAFVDYNVMNHDRSAMRYVLEKIAAGKISSEMERRGVPAGQPVRVVVDTLDGGLPLAHLAEEGGAFRFLADEPDLYSEADVRPS
jgi:hypothetical protein